MDQSKSVCSRALLLVGVLCLLHGAVDAQSAPAMGPLRRHPTNPRYFTDGTGKAVYLTGSHHWNNLQDRAGKPTFDYAAYLNFMQQHNHNFMRMWAWEERATPPIYRRTGPGTAADGGLKYDTNQLNPDFFSRLRSRVIAARDRGIYVSIMLFQGWSIEWKQANYNQWPHHYFNRNNNINGIHGDPNNDGNGREVHTLAVPAITALQDAYVRKVVDTVNDLDNVLFEISNESHTDSVQWHYHMINLIHNYEAGKPERHPVGMTSLGFSDPKYNSIPSNPPLWNSPADWISPWGGNNADGYITNPPASSGAKVVLPDTDHIWGNGGTREWVWKSFCRALNPIFMDVTPPLDDWTLATANDVRRAMGHTLTYARKMNLAAMTPQNGLSSTGYCLGKAGSEYLAYQPGSGAFTVNLAAATYAAEWFNPVSGAASSGGTFSAAAGNRTFTPPFSGQAALYLKSTTSPPPPTGNGTGLKGEYFDNIDFTAPKTTRTDATVNFDWGTGAPVTGVLADTFSVRWTGQVEAPASGTYTFVTASDDGVRLWVNGQLLINNWTDHSVVENSGTISLTAGQKYTVKMEFYERGGYAVAKLLWSGPGIAKQVVPQGRLYPAAGGAGLTAQYFDNIDFTALKLTRTDSTVNFDWSLNAPATGVAVDTFSVRWTGQVQAPATGSHTFTTASDDGVRLWVNGQLLINNWTDHSVVENSGTISLTAGQKYTVKMEFYERGGYAVAKLFWAGPGIAKQIIPAARLFP